MTTIEPVTIKACAHCGQFPNVDGQLRFVLPACGCYAILGVFGIEIAMWNARPGEDALIARITKYCQQVTDATKELSRYENAFADFRSERQTWWNTEVFLRNELKQLKVELGQALNEVEHVRELHAQVSQLRAELEEEKFSCWQVQQAYNGAQQEINELHALNLYDLVGDEDQLRKDMVETIKERDQLRMTAESQRKNIGVEIAKHAYTKSELEQAQEKLDLLKQGPEIIMAISQAIANLGRAFSQIGLPEQVDPCQK